jgi:acetoin utilization protein AcuB
MQREKISRLPVLDKDQNLVGIITQKDLLKASPSIATTLDAYEVGYLLNKVPVKKIMERHVLTVNEDVPIEEAARLMVDRNINCLPVMREGVLIGLVTRTDLFGMLINAFGARRQGLRVTILMENKPGSLARLTSAIAEKGSNIIAQISFEGDDPGHLRETFKLENMTKADITEIVEKLGNMEIEDCRG